MEHESTPALSMTGYVHFDPQIENEEIFKTVYSTPTGEPDWVKLMGYMDDQNETIARLAAYKRNARKSARSLQVAYERLMRIESVLRAERDFWVNAFEEFEKVRKPTHSIGETLAGAALLLMALSTVVFIAMRLP